MEATIDPTAALGPTASFGQEHFGECVFGDKRLTARAVITADALMRHPGGTLPAKLPKTELFGFHDFANNPKVNHDNVLAPHCQRTLALMQQCRGTVLIAHDTTEGDFSGLDIANLGQIGNGHCRGLTPLKVSIVKSVWGNIMWCAAAQTAMCASRMSADAGGTASCIHGRASCRRWVNE